MADPSEDKILQDTEKDVKATLGHKSTVANMTSKKVSSILKACNLCGKPIS